MKIDYDQPVYYAYGSISNRWHENKFKEAFKQLSACLTFKGHDTALILGLCYLHGLGTVKDPQKAAALFSSLQPGKITHFGVRGDDNGLMGCRVLEVRHDRVLLQTEDIFPLPNAYRKKPIFGKKETVWDRCAQRKWLNKEFIKEHFTKHEQQFLMETEVVTPPNPFYADAESIKNTADRVFLLSIQEYLNYYGLDTRKARRVQWTFYSETKRIGERIPIRSCTEEQPAFFFGTADQEPNLDGQRGEYLRTPGSTLARRCFVVGDHLFYKGFYGERLYPSEIEMFYRPAFWVRLK